MDFFVNSNLSQVTLSRYSTKLNEWLQYQPPQFNNIICLICFPEISLQSLNTHLKINTNTNKHNFIVALIACIIHGNHILSQFSKEYIDSIHSKWSDILKENDAPIVQRRLENLPTDNQLNKGGSQLTFNHFITIRDKLPLGSIERLLIAMYTMIPPVRADYFATQIIRGDEVPTQKNYIRILENGQMISTLTDFKTKKTYKQITNELPSELIIEINASLDKYPRSFLFLNISGKPFTRNSFTVWSRRILSKVFETDFTLVFFRHAFSTHYVTVNDISKMTDAQIKLISDKMGHSLEMFKAYRWIKDGNMGEIPLTEEESDEKE